MRKLFSLLFIFLALNLHAERKTVGLVLGGGGAKGAAHVGVLKVLEEAGIPIDYIAGTSIGAIVGAFYACGHDAHEIDSLMRQLNWKLLLSDQSPHNNLFYHTKEKEWKYVLNLPIKKQISLPAGIINGQNILNLFSDLTVGYHDLSSFNNLPIPFACVATDLTKGNSITLDSGSLPLAMRASMSIPGIFMPVTLDSMILVDGGVLNNLPTNVVKAMGADITIGVDLSTGKLTNEDLKTFNGVVEKIVDMMGNKEYLQNKKELDLCLNPDLKGFGTMSFSTGAMDSMYQSGIEVARKHLPEILALKDKIYNNDTTLVAPLKPMDNKGWNPNDTIQIANIYFDSIPPKEYKWFKKKANLVENSSVTIREINHAISVLDGLDLFSSVTYKLSDSTPADLTFILEKKALNQINIGFRFDTESMASILLNTTFSQKFFKGSELSVTAKLDKNPYLSLEYKWGPGPFNKIDMVYQIGYHNFNLYSHKKRIDNLYFLWQTGEIKYLGAFRNMELQAGVQWNYFGYSNEVYDTNYNPLELEAGSFFNYFARIFINSYANLYYPQKGWLGKMEAKLITNNFISYGEYTPIGTLSFDLETALSITNRFTILPRIAGRRIWGDKIPPIYLNCMGGDLSGRYLPQQIAFPGICNIQLFDNTLLMGQLAFRYRIAKKHYTYLIGGYAKNGDTLGSLLDNKNIWAGTAKYSYDSAIGPISIAINYSNWVKEVGVYINLGYYF